MLHMFLHQDAAHENHTQLFYTSLGTIFISVLNEHVVLIESWLDTNCPQLF